MIRRRRYYLGVMSPEPERFIGSSQNQYQWCLYCVLSPHATEISYIRHPTIVTLKLHPHY